MMPSPDYIPIPGPPPPPAVSNSVRQDDNGPGGRIPYYADTGCAFNSSCLSCPLPQCVLDMKPSQVRTLLHVTDRSAAANAVAGLVSAGVGQMLAIQQVAEAKGVSPRTVWRWVESTRREQQND